MNSFIRLLTNAVFVLFGLGPDVVTVSLGTAGNAGSTAAELITYMSARLLEVESSTPFWISLATSIPCRLTPQRRFVSSVKRN